ncbi:MAG: nitroreductase family protein [Candidatus Moduliflexus flocculans]|nr:nitroreductase family protein [Candidatus Moduliflexus flocculans]
MGIAGEHIVLQAEELGLATCWMGWISYRRVRKALGVPRKFKIVAMMPLGYAEKRPQREPPRRTLEEIVTFNRGAGRVRGSPHARLRHHRPDRLRPGQLLHRPPGRPGPGLRPPGPGRSFLVLFIGLALAFPLGRILMAVARGRLTVGPGRERGRSTWP